MTDPLSDEKVLESWATNAQPWIGAIRDDRIESRRLVTNQAIVDAVLSCNPTSVLDIGCGEGWLTRHLSNLGIHKETEKPECDTFPRDMFRFFTNDAHQEADLRRHIRAGEATGEPIDVRGRPSGAAAAIDRAWITT